MLKKSGKTRYKKTDKYRHNRCLMRHRKELGKHQGKCPVNSRYRPTKHPTWTSTKLGNDRRRLEQVSDGTGVAKEENGSTKEISLFFCLSECVCVCVCVSECGNFAGHFTGFFAVVSGRPPAVDRLIRLSPWHNNRLTLPTDYRWIGPMKSAQTISYLR